MTDYVIETVSVGNGLRVCIEYEQAPECPAAYADFAALDLQRRGGYGRIERLEEVVRAVEEFDYSGPAGVVEALRRHCARNGLELVEVRTYNSHYAIVAPAGEASYCAELFRDWADGDVYEFSLEKLTPDGWEAVHWEGDMYVCDLPASLENAARSWWVDAALPHRVETPAVWRLEGPCAARLRAYVIEGGDGRPVEWRLEKQADGWAVERLEEEDRDELGTVPTVEAARALCEGLARIEGHALDPLDGWDSMDTGVTGEWSGWTAAA